MRMFMRMILNYQLGRRNFYFSRVCTNRQFILPQSAASQVARWGKLDVYTGRLVLDEAVIKILNKYKMMNDFNNPSTTSHPRSS